MQFKVGDQVEYRSVKDGPGVLRKIRSVVPNGIPSCNRPMVMLEGVAGVVLESHCFTVPKRKAA